MIFSTDPKIDVAVQWPKGTYALVSVREHQCPIGFHHGCRRQDNDDDTNSNRHNTGIENKLEGDFGRDIRVCYCVKTESGTSVFSWPKGQYCIAKKNNCPSGFRHGSIYWDDDDDSNSNRRYGELPDGRYGRDTLIEYCCRTDGSVDTPIILPTNQPFTLFPYQSENCQRVSGMKAESYWMYTDDDDSTNGNTCRAPHPFDPNCSLWDHKIFFCYYSKA